MMRCTDENEKIIKQNYLRTQLTPGSIDVNILTKADREVRDKNGVNIPDGSEAVAALRGYMQSDLTNSAIIFSAGMNPRLYSYLENSDVFLPDSNFAYKKKVIVKVSDYRSALIQGKFLAKKGIWVSEFRIESGLNCGGHAFATEGFLLGPILEEFKSKQQELFDTVYEIYKPVVSKKLGYDFNHLPEIKVSVQGGIGTHEEDNFLHQFYGVSSTGWGTPFLLVPEATTVDEPTLKLLSSATEKDIVLSNHSPLGVRFHYLKGTTGEIEKQKRIEFGNPGSPCTEKHLALNSEFTEIPLCTASSHYQKLKIEQLKSLHLSDHEFEKQHADVVAKECLCVGLSNSASLNYDEPFLKNLTAVNVCPGPNIVNFSEVVSLQTMTDHIYGRTNIMTNEKRPHVFVAEMKLYITYLKEQLIKGKGDLSDSKRNNYFQSFIRNLTDAIQYYRNLPENFTQNITAFLSELQHSENELLELKSNYSLG